MKVKLIIITLVILGFSLKAQNTVRFNKQYDFFDTNASTSGYLSVNVFSINNDYVLGGIITTATINGGFGITRTDSIGNIKYQKQIAHPTNLKFGNNTANQYFIKLKNNNLLHTGQNEIAINYTRGCLARINHITGDTLWVKSYTQPGDTCFLLCTTELNDSSLIVFGYKFYSTFSTNSSKPFMMKVDKNGNYKWHKYINTNFSSTDYLYQKIIKINDNDFIVIGNKVVSVCYPQAFVMRIDTNAVQQYNVNFTGLLNPIVADAIPLLDGSILGIGAYFTVNTCDANPSKYKKFVYKFNPTTGAKFQSKTYNKQANATSMFCVQQKPNGTILIGGGTTDESTVNSYNTYADILTLNTNLDSLTTQYIFDAQTGFSQNTNQLILTPDGGFAAAIASYPNTGQQKFWLVKADSNGCYTSTCSTLGFNELKTKDEELKIYPNPANDIITIEFVTLSGVEADKYKIEILNSLGQVLQTANLQQPTTAISVKELPNGMYQLKISEGSTQKVIKFIKN